MSDFREGAETMISKTGPGFFPDEDTEASECIDRGLCETDDWDECDGELFDDGD